LLRAQHPQFAGVFLQQVTNQVLIFYMWNARLQRLPYLPHVQVRRFQFRIQLVETFGLHQAHTQLVLLINGRNDVLYKMLVSANKCYVCLPPLPSSGRGRFNTSRRNCRKKAIPVSRNRTRSSPVSIIIFFRWLFPQKISQFFL
jgi:hypothetical protein